MGALRCLDRKRPGGASLLRMERLVALHATFEGEGMRAEPGREYVLTLSCPDKPGIVYAVSSFLVQHSANILASQQYGESPAGRFFMRVHFYLPPPGRPLADLERGFSW